MSSLSNTLFLSMLQQRQANTQALEQRRQTKVAEDRQRLSDLNNMLQGVVSAKQVAFDQQLQVAQLGAQNAANLGKAKPQEYVNPRLNEVQSVGYDSAQAALQALQAKRTYDEHAARNKVQFEYDTKHPDFVAEQATRDAAQRTNELNQQTRAAAQQTQAGQQESLKAYQTGTLDHLSRTDTESRRHNLVTENIERNKPSATGKPVLMQSVDIRQLTDLQDLKTQISAMLAAKKNLKTGPIQGRLALARNAMGMVSPEETIAINNIKALQAKAIHAATGASAGRPERKDLIQSIPNINDDDENFVKSANNLLYRINQEITNELDIQQRAGRDISGFQNYVQPAKAPSKVPSAPKSALEQEFDSLSDEDLARIAEGN